MSPHSPHSSRRKGTSLKPEERRDTQPSPSSKPANTRKTSDSSRTSPTYSAEPAKRKRSDAPQSSGATVTEIDGETLEAALHGVPEEDGGTIGNGDDIAEGDQGGEMGYLEEIHVLSPPVRPS